MPDRLVVDDDALVAAAAATGELAEAWCDLAERLVAGVADGAGELTGPLLDGLHAFDVSWRTVLQVGADATHGAAAAALEVVATTTAVDGALGSALAGGASGGAP